MCAFVLTVCIVALLCGIVANNDRQARVIEAKSRNDAAVEMPNEFSRQVLFLQLSYAVSS